MHILEGVTKGQQNRMLTSSTLAFTVCFAVWTIFSIIGLQIKADLGLNDTQFGILVATPILTGSLSRIFLGIWTDQYGGRRVYTLLMLLTSVGVWLLSLVETYPMFLLAALFVGLAGGSFAVGIAYVSRWYERERQGTALGIFGMGNVGAAVTNFGAPYLLLALGWEQTAVVYAGILFITAILFFLFTKEDPATTERKAKGEKVIPALMQMTPLKRLQVWRFSLYYFFVFGAFVALALWLPRYYVGAYGLDIKQAGMFAMMYALPGSIFRALGGWLSDRFLCGGDCLCFALVRAGTPGHGAGHFRHGQCRRRRHQLRRALFAVGAWLGADGGGLCRNTFYHRDPVFPFHQGRPGHHRAQGKG